MTVVGTAGDSVAADRLIETQSPTSSCVTSAWPGPWMACSSWPHTRRGPPSSCSARIRIPATTPPPSSTERRATSRRWRASSRSSRPCERSPPGAPHSHPKSPSRAHGAAPAHAARSPDPRARGRWPRQRRDRRTPVAPSEDRGEPAPAYVRPLRRDEPDVACTRGPTAGLDRGRPLVGRAAVSSGDEGEGFHPRGRGQRRARWCVKVVSHGTPCSGSRSSLPVRRIPLQPTLRKRRSDGISTSGMNGE